MTLALNRGIVRTLQGMRTKCAEVMKRTGTPAESYSRNLTIPVRLCSAESLPAVLLAGRQTIFNP